MKARVRAGHYLPVRIALIVSPFPVVPPAQRAEVVFPKQRPVRSV